MRYDRCGPRYSQGTATPRPSYSPIRLPDTFYFESRVYTGFWHFQQKTKQPSPTFVRFGFPKEHFFPDYKNETHKKSNNIETYILKISVIPPSRHNHCLFIFLKVFLSFEIQIILWLQFYNIPFHLKICFCYFYRIILLNLHLKNGYLEFYYIKSP